MTKNKLILPTPQVSRGHHVLAAMDIVVGAVEREAAVKAAIEAERAQKPRRKSTSNLIKTAKCNDLTVTALNPDGSIITAAKCEAGNGHADSNEWDEWEAGRHETR